MEEEFLNRLELAKSNLPEHADGRAIYLKWIKPAMVDLGKVAAHYAVSSMFEPYQERTRVYSHQVTREDHAIHTAGRRKLGLGRIHVRSEITQESATFTYGVLHLGDHNLSGGVRPYQGPDEYASMQAEIVELFQREDVPDMIRAVDRQFGDESYSLRFLFRDEQHKIVRILLESALEEASGLYRSFYREYGPLARFLTEIGAPVPAPFQRGHRLRAASGPANRSFAGRRRRRRGTALAGANPAKRRIARGSEPGVRLSPGSREMRPCAGRLPRMTRMRSRP